MTIRDGRWSPGIGDPTAMGWVTATAYFGTALLCYWCTRREDSGGRRAFWLGLAVVMALLAVNKQLDLQSWFTQTGRDLAIAHGWYEQRGMVQIGFIAVLALSGLFCLVWLQRATRGLGAESRWAWLGLLLLALFVVTRAASFHHVDRLLRIELAGLRINWILELGGIACVAAAAIGRLRRVARAAGMLSGTGRRPRER